MPLFLHVMHWIVMSTIKSKAGDPIMSACQPSVAWVMMLNTVQSRNRLAAAENSDAAGPPEISALPMLQEMMLWLDDGSAQR